MVSKRFLAALLAASLLALSVSCGHGRSVGSGLAPTGRGEAPRTAGAPRHAPTAVSLDTILRDLDAYQPPKGVSAATWATLKAELKRLLIARSTDGKTVSIAPTWAGNSVTDLAALSNPAGTQATLTWTEALPGDYDNDGEVFISDLVPMAKYYLQRTDSGPDDAHRLVNGDSDPEINIADLQAVVNNYLAHIQGYQVWRGHWNGTSTVWELAPRPNPNPANPKWSADRPSPPPVSARPSYTFQDDLSDVSDKANVHYAVVAYGDGAMGAQSNEAVMPPPAYYAVSGTVTESGSGLAGVTLTLTPGGQTATTGADGTYTVTGVQNGTYTLTPTKIAYLFTPTSAQVTVAGADVGGNDFTGVVHPLAASPWPKFHADARNTGQSPYVGAQTNTVRWSTLLQGASPSIGPDGTVYINNGADDSTYALNPADGSVKWKTPTGGGECVPAVGADGTVYTEGLQDGSVYALNPVDGSVRWRRDIGNGSRSSPAIGADGTIFVGCNETLTSAYTFFALNPGDGSVKWKVALGTNVSSSPAIAADGTVYVGSLDHNVYAFDPKDGSVKWTYLTGGSAGSSPAVGADGTVYIGTGDGIVYALNGADGSVKWTYATGSDKYAYVCSSPALSANDTVVFKAFDYPNGSIYALSSLDGSLRWTFSTQDDSPSSAAIGADGTIYIGGGNSVLALNSQDGSLKWQYQSPDRVTSSPAIAADGTVYAVCSVDGIVRALYAFWP